MFVCEFDVSIEAFVNQVAMIARSNPRWSATWRGAGTEGFPVQVSLTDRLRGDFGGLEAEFDELAAALIWVRRAGSPRWRLRIDSIGGRPRMWSLEPCDWPSGTRERLASGHAGIFDRFRRKTRRFLSNAQALPAPAA